MEANLYGDKVIEMDEAMMDMIADAYAEAAYMAQFAGIDIVNIHGGHGWLINQFLSDLNNHRTDKYGGSIENKARFPLMIVDRIRQKCPNLIIEFRLSGDEETEGGMKIDEVVEFCKMLDGKADIIHVSAATFHDTGSAARRGHQVILCEKSDHLAANLDYSKQVSFKWDIVTFVKAMTVNLQRTPNVEIRLDTEVTEELIRAEQPDVIIAACGAEPIVPPIPGVDKPIVHHVTELFKKHLSVGSKVVIIGGGLAGCEEGLSLAWEGKDVTIVEMKDGLAKDAPYIHWRHLLTKVNESVHSYCSAKVLSIEDDGVVIVDKDGQQKKLEADTVLLAAGMRATSEKFDAWHDLAEDVIVVGDCRRSSKILEAMRTGYCAGTTI